MQEGMQELTTEAPEVSVVMSVYNGALHLRETVDSILSQEGVALELVVVDDGSTDDTANLLSQYASRDARVRVITQENQGLTKALIKGCAGATGQYIARQDVGDTSYAQRLYLQKQALDADHELAFVSCWTEFCGPEWEFLYLVKGTGRAASPVYIISETEENGTIDGPTCHPSVMFRRQSYERVGGYRAEFRCAQDWDLWYRLAEVGKLKTLQQPLYKARLVPDGISSYKKQEQAALGGLALEGLLKRRRGLSDQDVLDKVRRVRAINQDKTPARTQAKWLYFIGECLRRNNDRRSLIYFAKSIRMYPLNFESWLKLLQASVHSW
jgi:glycosyltransferase involved in cell wall biosynthesis